MKYASVLTCSRTSQAGRATPLTVAAVVLIAAVLTIALLASANQLNQSGQHAGLRQSLVNAAAAPDPKRLAQRRNYQLALKDLAKNDFNAFNARRTALLDYPLTPYLEYHYLNKMIDTVSNTAMAEFRNRFADYPFTEPLRNRWLLRLPTLHRWSDYLENYEPSRSTTRRCYYLRALYRSGERTTALNQVQPLWLHGSSQPKACDALFDAWIGAGYLNDELVWKRLTLALSQNEVTLAKYLRTLLTTQGRERDAEALYEAHVRPQTRFNPEAYRADNQTNREILSAGLQSLARKDPEAALAIWRRVQLSHSFKPENRIRIETRLFIAAAQDELYPADPEPANVLSDGALEQIAREAVRQQNWSQANRWIGMMTKTKRAQPEWLYWQSRSQGGDLTTLAGERNYYGFLAAQEEGLDTHLNHQPTKISPQAVAALSKQPGFERALELYAVDDVLNARREWRAAFAELSQSNKAAAAQLAQQNGWLDQAIVSANAAKLHNDLDLRFPQEFTAIYGQASDATKIPQSTLMAVTRQESAFAQKARSHANARGLMQLLPATAKRTAKKAGLRQPSNLDLYEPAINIRIASEYLKSLMNRYDQQRPLAFAAYNAGEHRVDRWIKDRSGMPMEVWIETIPYRETRGYVKSVLAFNHLYSKRMNDPMPLLLPNERTVN